MKRTQGVGRFSLFSPRETFFPFLFSFFARWWRLVSGQCEERKEHFETHRRRRYLTCKYKTWVVSNRNDLLWKIPVFFIFIFFVKTHWSQISKKAFLFCFSQSRKNKNKKQKQENNHKISCAGPPKASWSVKLGWDSERTIRTCTDRDISHIFIYMFWVVTGSCALVYHGRLM